MSFTRKILIGLLALVGIGVAYWLISPLFIERIVSEELAEIALMEMGEQLQIIASGSFEGLATHNAMGTARLLKIGDKYYIRFEDDFRVTNGPDLFVHFGKNGEYDPAARLASLKGNSGSQNYEIPENIDFNNYDEVWIWCRAFSVPFGKAALFNK
jgi:hypothetical protein